LHKLRLREVPREEVRIKEARLDLPLDRANRTPGLHQSAIIKDLLIHTNPQRFGQDPDAFTLPRFLFGFMLENLLGTELMRQYYPKSRSRILLQPEIEYDGILMTPDLFNLSRWRLGEFKATWISSANPIAGPRFWHWIVQIKGYLKALGARDCDLAVFHVCGDWRPAQPIQPKLYRLRFSQAEIDQNWNMLLKHARTMKTPEAIAWRKAA
jgi:hypothetical protein